MLSLANVQVTAFSSVPASLDSTVLYLVEMCDLGDVLAK